MGKKLCSTNIKEEYMTASMVWHFAAIVVDALLILYSNNKYVKILSTLALICMVLSLCDEFGVIPVVI